MDKNNLTLDNLNVGDNANVVKLNTNGNEKRRFLDLGMVKDTNIEALYKSPCGDPVAYYIRGAVIALRSEDARKIIIDKGDC